MVFAYSNILTECRDRAGQTIGVTGVVKRLRQLDPRRPKELSSSLVSQLKSEAAGNLVADDISLLLCQATKTRVSWRDNLLAPFRLLRRALDETRIG